MIRVVIADDEAMIRAGLRMLLDHQPDIEVVGEAADGVQARDEVRRTSPDVVLMDVRMPRADGITAARQILAESAAKVVILTTFDEDAAVQQALKAGVSGFLLKVAPPEQLVHAVRTVAAGQALLDPAVTLRVIESFAAAPGADPRAAERLKDLTEREVDVLRLVARGRSNAEIAAELYLGEATVKTYVSRMLTKLDLRDRVQAVAFAYESGLITPGSTGTG
ncbi:response regulator transcription factor [Dactylosporangium sp. AC04546]|uniref:response regulator transcription factor n=1 Tax=Dactylosporangium sp. AC04546 TaxID=2862460 RepID=UPI001EDFC1B9|nr:response regulator transcription factor [Dactylosporangium sp. AC04546]WVK87750.1 response regulator transcription factor [Dactylosporangium sp. AC04546]